ncbi:MAG: DNA repair protein RecN, partial [Caldimicrobium sp.]
IKTRDINPSFLTPNGLDEVEFLFSSNPGLPLRPLEMVVSGGELSRIYLAFRSLLKEKKGVQTLIFDEIDTGIGGETAIRVGEKLKKLSQEVQIFCITHLPQIVRFADHHFIVEKLLGEKGSITTVREIKGEERLKELARMLGDANNLDLAEKFLAGKSL